MGEVCFVESRGGCGCCGGGFESGGRSGIG